MTALSRSAGRTETGNVRRRNEDAILVRDDLGLWAVADGLGGHAAGDFASTLIVERLGALQRRDDVHEFVAAIEDCLQQVNAELRAAAVERQVDVIGSTVALLVLDAAFVLCGWVGDSRIYVHENGALEQLTRDHVQGQPADITRVDARAIHAVDAGMLTRAVGVEETLYIDWAVAGHRPGMQFLLCSDGINKELSDDEMASICSGPLDVRQQVDRLCALALGRLARDNLSAVIVRLDAA
ncbi:PP2C family protein-serine/threonine phosphatase [Paraburkholderia aromaticivorans]|uniref:Phosphoprotein phosphatase n=1 Tax=Paraburkholderia aromaticivorans TaxID=2026199 RepID=A0A248VXC6_9BURK|nr:PP2C family serine/threonine-protein phosphatase [Paraburkholderia aromaticivorans]ASW03533.1 phosphoprotein phosphatase [Paraburkholderia aromaticivorans]